MASMLATSGSPSSSVPRAQNAPTETLPARSSASADRKTMPRLSETSTLRNVQSAPARATPELASAAWAATANITISSVPTFCA